MVQMYAINFNITTFNVNVLKSFGTYWAFDILVQKNMTSVNIFFFLKDKDKTILGGTL